MAFPPTSNLPGKQKIIWILGIAAVAAFFLLRSNETKYDGLSAEEWILNFRGAPTESRAKLAEIGADAIPAIERMFHTENSPGGSTWQKAASKLPTWLGGAGVDDDERQQLAAMACCAIADSQKELVPVVIERIASNSEIKIMLSFAVQSGAHLGGIQGSSDYNPANWLKQGSYRLCDYLAVYCALAGEEALLPLAQQSTTESGPRQARLLLTFSQALHILGAYPQNNNWFTDGLPWTPLPFTRRAEWKSFATGCLPLASHEDADVRSAAIYALAVLDGAGIQVEGARAAILKCADDPNAATRAWFVRAAGNLATPDEHTLPAFPGLNVNLEELDVLEPLLSSNDLDRLKSLRGSGRPALSDAQDLLRHAMKSVRLEALHALGKSGAEAKTLIPLLLEPFVGGDEDEWRAARSSFRLLARTSETEVMAALRQTVRHEDPAVRARAGQTLAIINKKDRTSQILVIRALGDANVLYHNDPKVVRTALSAFAALGTGAANDALPSLLRFMSLGESEANKGCGALALASVGRSKPNDVIPALTKALSSAETQTVAGAITALGRMGKDATPQIPTLKAFLKDERTFDLNALSWKQGVGRLQAQAAQAIALIESAD